MKKINIAIVLLSLFILSCGDLSQEINWNVDEIPPRLVVEGSVTSELKHQQIRLTRSDNYFSDKEAPTVSNALVRVDDGTTTYEFTENPNGSGLYESVTEFAGVPGSIYHLDVELTDPLNDEIHYSATSELRKGFTLDSLSVELFDNPFSFNEEDTVITVFFMFGQEPEATHDYYLVKFYRNNKLITDTIDKAPVIDDETYGINGEQLFPIYMTENFLPGDTAGIKVYSINKQYTEFLNGINKISQGTDPLGFSGPPANAIGNIEGGEAFGYFIASDVVAGSAVIDSLLVIE